MQFAAAIEEGKGVLFGTVMAMAPIAAITLWVVEVRRMFRLQGRAAGTVAQPAATIEPALWLRFFKQAWTAKKFALIDRSLGADDAMKLGILHAQPKPKALVAPVRRDRGIAVEDVLPQLRSLTASPTADRPDGRQPGAEHRDGRVRLGRLPRDRDQLAERTPRLRPQRLGPLRAPVRHRP